MSEFYWQKVKSYNAKEHMIHAVLAGKDSDGSLIYVGRGKYDGDLIPAKVIPARSKASVPWGGNEMELSKFEMYLRRPCIGPEAMIERWIPCSNGKVPQGALKVGETRSGEPLYMGRAHHDGSITPGKIHASHGCLYIPYGYKEHSYKEYEVLVVLPASGAARQDSSQVFVAPIQPAVQAQYIPQMHVGYIPPNQSGAHVPISTAYVPPSYAPPTQPGAHVPIASGYVPPSYAPPPTTGPQMPILPVEALQNEIQTKLTFSEAPPTGTAEKVDHRYGWNSNFSPAGQIDSNQSAHVAQWNHMPEMPANFYPQLPKFDHVESNVITKQAAQKTNAVPHAAYIWQKLDNRNAASFADRAVYAGRDGDGAEIYVGRAVYKGDLLPAKVIPKHKAAYVSYDGKEIAVEEFEMYLRPISVSSLRENWVPDGDGSVPNGALQGGHTAAGEVLYVGRVQHEGTITPGKVQPSNKCLYIPYGSKEISFKKYEVLVIA